MIRRKKGQNFTEESHDEIKNTAENPLTEDNPTKKRPRFSFSKNKKQKEEDLNLYDNDMLYVEDDKSYQEEYEQNIESFEEIGKEEGVKSDKKEKRIWKKKRKEKEKKKQNKIVNETDTNMVLGADEKGDKKGFQKKLILIAGAAVIVVGAIVYFMVNNIHSGEEGKAYVESVRVIAGLGSANGMNNRYTGEIEAQDSWKITLQSDLSVDKCYVSVGDEIKKGDKLFSYNTEELKLSRDKKQLEVDTMQNENTQLSKDIKTYESDLKSASATEKIELQTQILTAQTTIKKNEYSIKSGKEEIENIKKNIKDATVKSKMDGVVKSINASAGQSSGGDSEGDASDVLGEDSGEDSTYMTILAIGDYRVKGSISETNVWAINEGDPVIIRSRVDDSTWRGTISKVKTDTTEDSTEDSDSSDMDYMYEGSSGGESASKYNFYVELDDDEGLMMGQHVFIEIDRGQDTEKDGIWIPSAYIKVDGDKYYVWAANSRDRLELRQIEVGEYDEDLDEYEVLSGIAARDYIACDAGNLKENMKTSKVDSEEDSTGEYYEEETSDDEMYNEGDYDDESLADDDFSDEDFSDEDLIDEGLDGFSDEGISDEDLEENVVD